jgi:hypothetical protein
VRIPGDVIHRIPLRWWECRRIIPSSRGCYTFEYIQVPLVVCLLANWRDGPILTIIHVGDHLGLRKTNVAHLMMFLGLWDVESDGGWIFWRRLGRPKWKSWWPTMRKDLWQGWRERAD